MINATISDLAIDAVEKAAETYRVVRGVMPSLPAGDFEVRDDALARIIRYCGDVKAARQMKGKVVATCTILARDFASIDKPGLANLVHLEYDVRIAAWQRRVQDGTAQELAADAMAKLSREQQRADRTLAEAAQALAAFSVALKEEPAC